MKKHLYGILLFIFIFNGCSFRHEVVDKTQNIMLKDNKTLLNTDFKKTHKILKIRTPDLPLYLNSRYIVYTYKGFSNKYAHYFWADLPSNLYSFLILSKLEQSQMFTTVLLPTSSLNAHYALESTINSFEQIIDDENHAKISLSINLINLQNNQIIAHKNFTHKENIKKQDMHALYNAFEKAINKITNDIVSWINSKI
ncbi:ABC-type transport auxiliary lipoprotein family protein [Campylobacter sp. VicNov18]|uniref:ABC-type transport auxiliary lipoprotein family protein n=1 Tax=Campylobacter bilis TaxID=2691918 RepID=UPI00130EF3EB|nr:ABC-type transport auxiliary lipoprotein family protein [Campylobacter bilis]MPV63741.1 hypothetical protein [Campylobacter hepaticus]MBM0637242.1 hypothetical protein [Campylobacter bilis]MCC8277961.1 ABC-type transport auxiliary lipoprotein family protein [Campylobacter bilis]MCC8299465.1 ABC-type transport auxiliary lipoprotein family protein [Campylobacter bilis]MCC8300870.1 ABC-type transport auxiliary lipoprotein family protein [Campylobacter bilis]